MANRRGKSRSSDRFFLGSKITVNGDCSHEIRRHWFLRRKAVTNLDSIFKIKDITLLTKGCIVKTMVSHVQMWEMNHREGWALKNWYFQIVVLQKTLESSLDTEEIKPVSHKGNQPLILIRRTDAEAEAPVLWLLDTKSQLNGKDPEARKDWGQQRMRWLDSVTDSKDVNFSKLWVILKDREAWCAAVHGVMKSQTWLTYCITITTSWKAVYIKDESNFENQRNIKNEGWKFNARKVILTV